MDQLRVGIVGCGLITQVEHLPNLLALPELFKVIGVADPSAKVRAHLTDRTGVASYATADELFGQKPDAVVVATPDAYHADIIVQALARGFHVFTEKPLCYDVADARRILAARNKAARVVQVGYMKRFDPAYRALCDLIAARPAGPLLAVTVDVVDSDAWAYVAHRDLLTPDDVPAELVAEGRARRQAQVAAALGGAPDALVARGFAGPFCSSLVHDINLVQGLLEAAGTRLGAPVGAAFIAGDTGGALLAKLEPQDAAITMSWVAAPKVAYYSERISLVYADAVYELRFPSPYLNHQPTQLFERRSSGHHLTEIAHRPSYAEPFIEELKAWHAAITEGAVVVNTVEQAMADISLLAQFARLAAVA
ncbi:MAG: Gfo/Idh/MocA family oxidoreductase [Devosia nanyangense]|uniref:Gfo/Idh/MocA family oxidoreductase n=1 Tax=Devosia nanyangense TaxID=1228055 RepID=A0A933NYH4_9HYPH|nr:Gfo/Idh/MocA family oxidoreductase [Devosia nanyangense]